MICPKCNGKMLTGYIPIYALAWVPQYGELKKSEEYYVSENKKEGFQIGKNPTFQYKKQPAYYCPNCEILLIDTTKDEF